MDTVPAAPLTHLLTNTGQEQRAGESGQETLLTAAPQSSGTKESDLDHIVLADLDFTMPALASAPATAEPSPTARADKAKPADVSPRIENIPAQDTRMDSTALYLRLADTRQFALAGWLADALQLAPEVSAAHRLVAHASAMRGSAARTPPRSPKR